MAEDDSSALFTEQLVEYVYLYPVLYDMNHKDFKNIKKKDRIWQEIGKEMHESGELLKKKWKNLRDSYMKHLRATKCSAGQAKKNYKGWQWSATMERFRPFVTFAQTESNVSRPGSENNIEAPLQPPSTDSQTNPQPRPELQIDETDDINDNDNSLSNEGAVELAVPQSTDNNGWKRKRKAAKTTEMSNTDKVIEYLKNNRGEVMEDIDYGMLGYAKTIKKFSPRGQALTKLKIAEIINNQELEELNSSRPSSSSSMGYTHSDQSNAYWEENSGPTTPEGCSLDVFNVFKRLN